MRIFFLILTFSERANWSMFCASIEHKTLRYHGESTTHVTQGKTDKDKTKESDLGVMYVKGGERTPAANLAAGVLSCQMLLPSPTHVVLTKVTAAPGVAPRQRRIGEIL